MNSELREKIIESASYHFGINVERDTHSEGVDEIMQLITQSNLDLLKRLEEEKYWMNIYTAPNNKQKEGWAISLFALDRERERIEKGE